MWSAEDSVDQLVELIRRERGVLAVSGEVDVLVDEYGVQAGDGIRIASSDLAGFLGLLNDSGEDGHRLGRGTDDDIGGVGGQGWADDCGVAGDAAQQAAGSEDGSRRRFG